MTEKRPLTDEEKTVTNTAIARLSQDRQYQAYLIHYANLMLQEGLYVNFWRQKDEWNQKLNAATDTAKELDSSLSILHDQLENGVTPKETIDPSHEQEDTDTAEENL